MRVRNLDTFLNNAQQIHGDRYDYSQFEYVTAKHKSIVICRIHGQFLINANNHFNGKGCPQCALDKHKTIRKYTTESFIEVANLKHSNKYDYSKTVYLDIKTKIIVTCVNHGDFNVTPDKHINECNSCPECAKENRSSYSRSAFIQLCNSRSRTPCLYILRCFNDNESFYKIGITSTTIKRRYSCKADMPYSYEIIQEIRGEPEYIWNLEKTFHTKLSQYCYVPNISFGGSIKECFSKIEDVF